MTFDACENTPPHGMTDGLTMTPPGVQSKYPGADLALNESAKWRLHAELLTTRLRALLEMSER